MVFHTNSGFPMVDGCLYPQPMLLLLTFVEGAYQALCAMHMGSAPHLSKIPHCILSLLLVWWLVGVVGGFVHPHQHDVCWHVCTWCAM